MAKALRGLGYPPKELELKNGVDIMGRMSLAELARDIEAGKALGVMIATPCISFSIAQM